MANNCCFDMKIVGKEEAVKEFVKLLKWEQPFEHNGLGRVFSFDTDPSLGGEDPRHGSDLVAVYGFGDCAWSVHSAMMKASGYSKTLEGETERLGLCVEIFSSEPGIGFQEHYIIDKGNVVEDKCVDYTEICFEGYDKDQIKDLLNDLGITVEELFENINENGDYTSGGFDNYGDFEDLFSYFPLEAEKLSLAEQIKKAESLTTSGNASEMAIEER